MRATCVAPIEQGSKQAQLHASHHHLHLACSPVLQAGCQRKQATPPCSMDAKNISIYREHCASVMWHSAQLAQHVHSDSLVGECAACMRTAS